MSTIELKGLLLELVKRSKRRGAILKDCEEKDFDRLEILTDGTLWAHFSESRYGEYNDWDQEFTLEQLLDDDESSIAQIEVERQAKRIAYELKLEKDRQESEKNRIRDQEKKDIAEYQRLKAKFEQ